MNFLSRFLPYPEYTALENSWNSVSESEIAVQDGMKRAFNTSFQAYARTQVPVLKDVLMGVCIQGMKQHELVGSVVSYNSQFGTAIKPLRTLFDEKNKQTKELEEAESQLNKSIESRDKLRAALESYRSQNKVNAISKTEQALAEAERKAEANQSAFAEAEAKIEKLLAEYPKNVASTLVSSLEDMVDVRIRAAKQMENICNDFEKKAEEFKDFEDETILRYQQYIEDLLSKE